MSAVVKKYIKFILHLDDLTRKYTYECFQNEIELDLEYITSILFNIETEKLIECANSERYRFLQTEEFELTLSEDDEAGIVSIYDQPFNGYCYTEMNYFHYSLKRDDFKDIAINYKLFFENKIAYFYLILLSNNRVVLQKELHDTLFKTPKKWLNYVKIAYEKNDLSYKEVERTSNELDWFFWFYFEPENREKMLEYYDNFKKNGQVPEHISLAEIERIMQESFLIKNQKNPVYFVKNDAGKIEVRKSILSLRHVLLERAQDGSYEIKDECGIGVFDFLEEFALGFSPERFLEEYQEIQSVDEIHATHKHIEITYSKQENVIRLKLGKAPYEFEYIERKRDRYFECRLFEMSLYEFVALMIYWRALKEKATPEIYFTQRDDGALVIKNR